MDRRTSIKWIVAAAAAVPALRDAAFAASAEALARDVARTQAGYGTDPALIKDWKPGGPWPLTLNADARKTVTAIADLIIPADEHSPAASSVGVVDFIDEWISAPYPQQRGDRDLVLTGLAWLETESQKRFGKGFAAASDAERAKIADDICSPPRVASDLKDAARFFAKMRDLTAGGFYTTPVGMKDIGYTGNVPLASFDGPPLEALKKVGLA
jgi:hypothetical protein